MTNLVKIKSEGHLPAVLSKNFNAGLEGIQSPAKTQRVISVFYWIEQIIDVLQKTLVLDLDKTLLFASLEYKLENSDIVTVKTMPFVR